MADVKKEEERGEGLLSRAGRYAREPGGSEAAGSPEGETKTPRTEDVEKETERVFVAPPPQPGGGPQPERVGRRERKGLLRRALAVSEEQPVSRRLSRRERRMAEKAASEAGAARAFEAVVEEPIQDATIGETAFVETPLEETPFVEKTPVEKLSFGEEVFAGSGEPSEVAMGMPQTAEPEIFPAQTLGQEGEGPVAGEIPAEPSVVLTSELQAEPSVDLTSEFPAELDFGEEVAAASEAAVAESAPKRKGGLLAMASLFAEKEVTGDKAAGRARQAVRPSAPGVEKTGAARKAPRAPAAKATTAEMKRPSRAAKAQISRLEEQAAPPRGAAPEEAVFGVEGEAALPETAGMPGAGLSAELKDFARFLESCLSKRDALSALDLFNESVAREGYTSFILRILETMTSLGKGKSGLLIVHSKDRYVAELRVPPLEKQAKLKNVSFRQESRFIQALKESGRGIFRPGGRTGDLLKKETSALGSLSPWVAVPLAVGNELVAFVVIGRQPDRPKTDEEAVALLARLSAPYVNKYLLLKEHRFALSSLEKELKERDSLYALYSAFESPREKLELPERCVRALIEGVSANLGIVSAVVLADWKPKTAAGSSAQGIGSYFPVASIGVPERALARYRVSTKDREILAIVETGRPSVPKDAPKRKQALSRYASSKTGGSPGDAGAASRWPKSYVVAPLLFNGDSLGFLVVHEMKGVKKTLTGEAAERLRQASRVLVPALLYGKLHSMSPFDAMRGLISSRVEEAKRNDVPLAVAVFTIENAKRACGELGFGKYWGVVERLRRLIENAAGEKGVVKDIDWNRLALFFREHGENEMDDVIAQVRTGFSGGLRKNERESGISLATLMTRYPKDSKSAEDILFSIM
jgi:hypothetical protein